jgi:hypothetical protein
MYKVKFNTEKFKSKGFKGWEQQLMNDFAVAINGKEFTCQTDLDLHNRLSFIHGSCYSSKNKDMLNVWKEYEQNKDNYFELTYNRYGTQRLKYGMYGIPQGYVDNDQIINDVKSKKLVSIPFNDFYDLRQKQLFQRMLC